MCDLLTDAIVEQVRRARAQAQPHQATADEIKAFRAVTMARDALRVGKAVLAQRIDAAPQQAYPDTH